MIALIQSTSSSLDQPPSRSPGPRAAKRQMQDDNDWETATLEDGTFNSLTIGEEILQVLQMYMARKYGEDNE